MSDIHIIGGLAVRTYRNGDVLKPQGHSTGGHDHNFHHATLVYKRHRLIIYGKVIDPDTKEQRVDSKGPMWYEKSNRVLAGNGVLRESIVPVHSEEKHDLIALEPGCAHFCIFVPMEAVGKTVGEFESWVIQNHWTGFMESTE